LVTGIVLALFFGKLYYVIQGNFADIDRRLADGTMVNLNAGKPAQNIRKLLEKGFYFEDKNDAANIIWDAIFAAGAAQGIKPIGLGARDTLRLEMGYCLYGNDIDDTTSPLEAGLAWITKFTKDFISRDIFEKQKAKGLTKKLVGFEMTEKGIARHDYEIKDFEGSTIGRVTSGTQSPSLGKAIGMGYVDSKYAAIDSEIFIKVRHTLLKAKVVKMPFA
jgi:aminomethyltransferase